MSTRIQKLVIIEKVTAKIPNRYEAVRVIAKEARRLNSLVIRGADVGDDFKPTTAAVERLTGDKLKFQYVDEVADTGDLFED